MSAYDNSNSGRRGRIIAISAIVLLGILVTLFMLKRHYENKIAARIAEELTYYSPIARLANAEVDVSLLSSSITLRDVVYVFNNLPLTLSIAKITSTGVDRDALLDSPGAMTHMDKLVMENMLFSSQTQEDALFSTAYYELNNLTYGYRDLRNTLREHKDSEDIAAWLRALLPHMGGTIFGNAVLRDTKMNVPFYHQTMFKINIAEASSSGLRPLDPAVDGFDAIEDSSHIRDFLMEFTNFVDHETVYFKLEEIGMKGGKFNRAGLLTAVGDLLEEGADVEAGLFNLLALAHNYAFERFYFKNLQVNGNNISFKLDDVDLTNHTPKEQGPDRLRNLRVTMGQRDIFTLEEAGLDKSVFSDRLVQIYSRMAELLNNEEIIREFADQPYETLKGLRLENLYLKNLRFVSPLAPKADTMFGLGHLRGDVDLGEKGNFKLLLREVHFDLEEIKKPLAAIFGASPMLQNLEIALKGKKSLIFNSDYNLDLLLGKNLPEGTMAELGANLVELVHTFALSEKDLGELKLALDVRTDLDKAFLRKMETSFLDKGLLNNVLDYYALQSNGRFKTREDVRKYVLDEKMATASNTHLEALVKAMRKFISSGGSLHVSINPSKPIPMENLTTLFTASPQLLGLEASHEPAP